MPDCSRSFRPACAWARMETHSSGDTVFGPSVTEDPLLGDSFIRQIRGRFYDISVDIASSRYRRASFDDGGFRMDGVGPGTHGGCRGHGVFRPGASPDDCLQPPGFLWPYDSGAGSGF